MLAWGSMKSFTKMKFNLTVLFVFAGLAASSASAAQLSVYLEGTSSNFHDDVNSNYLSGGTLGLLYDGPAVFRQGLLSANVQTRYVQAGGKRLIGAAVGPRLSFQLNKWKLRPYGEFMLGFARYRPGSASGAENTTDNQWQANVGISRQLTSRLDVVLDYSYSQYGTNNGEYNPKSYSAGIVYHFNKH